MIAVNCRQHVLLDALVLPLVTGAARVEAQPLGPAAPVSPGRNWAMEKPDDRTPLDMRWDDSNWWWTLCGGIVTNNNSSRIARFDPNFGGTYLVAGTLGREWDRRCTIS